MFLLIKLTSLVSLSFTASLCFDCCLVARCFFKMWVNYAIRRVTDKTTRWVGWGRWCWWCGKNIHQWPLKCAGGWAQFAQQVVLCNYLSNSHTEQRQCGAMPTSANEPQTHGDRKAIENHPPKTPKSPKPAPHHTRIRGQSINSWLIMTIEVFYRYR